MLRFVLFAVLVVSLPRMVRAEPYRETLTSVAKNASVSEWKVTGKEVTPGCPTAWSIKKYPLHGGKQEGVELIVLDNGKLQITLCPTRGMGVLSVTMGDVRLGWDSPVKEIVHPKHINLSARGGLGWLDGFNEWMCRCGLESNGHPGTDKFINNVGDEATMDLTLHGKIANLPAQEVEVVVDREAPYRIRVRGLVHERMFMGPKLALQTELSTEPGSATFRITDEITNNGAADQEFQILYHTNFGKPLLEAGATFLAPIDRITPFNENAAKGMKMYAEYAGPKAGFIEQVYCIVPRADTDGRTLILLQNKGKDRGASLSFFVKELPYLTQWKNTAAEEDGYVTGLEPGTGFPFNRRIERKFGRVPKLAPHASRSFSIDYAIHAGEAEVKTIADRIATIQGDHKPTIDEKPVKTD
jgi:hypothetical protein